MMNTLPVAFSPAKTSFVLLLYACGFAVNKAFGGDAFSELKHLQVYINNPTHLCLYIAFKSRGACRVKSGRGFNELGSTLHQFKL